MKRKETVEIDTAITTWDLFSDKPRETRYVARVRYSPTGEAIAYGATAEEALAIAQKRAEELREYWENPPYYLAPDFVPGE